MPDSWVAARDAYKYPVNLADFADKHKYPGFFESDICGCLDSTRAFQKRFAENAPYHLEAWYEVVYWKYYFIPNKMKRDDAVRSIIRNIRQAGITANELWELCCDFTRSDDLALKDFRAFQRKIVRGKGVAVAATFPAFLDPMRFPMVDRHVADWARQNGKKHGFVPLRIPPAGKTIDTDDWGFVRSWIKWCRFTASKLNELTGDNWGARDVEMAVFTADRNSNLTLNSLR